MDTNDFINSIDNKLYNRIRQSKSDSECRRYLKEHLEKQLLIHVVSKPVICCPQCGNERLESTGDGWYICGDRNCDWGDKL